MSNLTRMKFDQFFTKLPYNLSLFGFSETPIHQSLLLPLVILNDNSIKTKSDKKSFEEVQSPYFNSFILYLYHIIESKSPTYFNDFCIKKSEFNGFSFFFFLFF